jgi:hypothetical protein
MKKIKLLIIMVISFVLISSFLSDWKNFKAGLFGKPPIINNTYPFFSLLNLKFYLLFYLIKIIKVSF